MCFIISEKHTIFQDGLPTPRVADKDIWVWKNIGIFYTGCYYFTPPYLNKNDEKVEEARWIPGRTYVPHGKLPTIPFSRDHDEASWEVNEGAIHSSKNHNGFSVRSTFKMYIPKGSLYFENDEEYVSNKLVFPLERHKEDPIYSEK